MLAALTPVACHPAVEEVVAPSCTPTGIGSEPRVLDPSAEIGDVTAGVFVPFSAAPVLEVHASPEIEGSTSPGFVVAARVMIPDSDPFRQNDRPYCLWVEVPGGSQAALFYKAEEGRLVSDPILFAVGSDLARFDALTEQELEATVLHWDASYQARARVRLVNLHGYLSREP